MSDRVCPICGKSFARKGKRVYCSPECSKKGHDEKNSAAQKKRIAKRREGGKICPVCGTNFTPTHQKQKYCSKECYKVVFKQQCKECRERKKNGEPARKKKLETVGDKRPCHGCGKPSYNYWCPACWRKRAQKYGIPEEDVPGVRYYEQEVE